MDRVSHGKQKFTGASTGNFVIQLSDTTFAPKRVLVNTLAAVPGAVAAPLMIEKAQLPVSFTVGGPAGTAISIQLTDFAQGKVKGLILTNNMGSQLTKVSVLAFDGDSDV